MGQAVLEQLRRRTEKRNGFRGLLGDFVRSRDRVLGTVRHTELLGGQILWYTLSAMHGKIAVNPNAVQYVTYPGAYPAYRIPNEFPLGRDPARGTSCTISWRWSAMEPCAAARHTSH